MPLNADTCGSHQSHHKKYEQVDSNLLTKLKLVLASMLLLRLRIVISCLFDLITSWKSRSFLHGGSWCSKFCCVRDTNSLLKIFELNEQTQSVLPAKVLQSALLFSQTSAVHFHESSSWLACTWASIANIHFLWVLLPALTLESLASLLLSSTRALLHDLPWFAFCYFYKWSCWKNLGFGSAKFRENEINARSLEQRTSFHWN